MSFETRLEPEGARSGATRITGAANTLHGSWSRLKGQIEGLHAAKPWGDDEAGNAFNEHYSATGDASPALQTIAGATELIGAMKRVGPAVTTAVNNTVSTDSNNAGAVNQTY